MADRRLPGERLAGEIATAVLRNIDANEIARNIDVDELVARIDVDALVARLDVDALVARLDVEAIARRVPVEELVGTSTIQRAVDGVDLGPALRRAGLADIVAQSVGRSTLDTLRRRVVVIDALGERLTGNLLRQDIDSWPAGPVALVGDETGPLGDLDGGPEGVAAWNVAGQYVGPLGRALATVLDVTGAVSSWTLLTTIVLTLLARGFTIGLALWIGGWFLLPLEVFGRTPAMGLLGRAVVTGDGRVPTFRRILLRSIVQLPSVVLFGIGYVWTLVDRQRRTLHDRVAGTAVVWDWGGRDATIASPLSRWVAGDDDRGGSP